MSELFVAPEFPELEFKEKNHTYWLYGTRIPSVSELMRPLSDSMYKGIDAEILDLAAERGSTVHEAIENFAKYGIEDCKPEYQGYFDGFLAWVNENRVEILASEIMAYNRVYRYAGTLDLICNVRGERWLVDVKTTAQVNRMLTSVQLEAYKAALVSHGITVDRKAVLHLKKAGKPQVHIADKASGAEAWMTFGALMTVYGHIQKYKKG